MGYMVSERVVKALLFISIFILVTSCGQQQETVNSPPPSPAPVPVVSSPASGRFIKYGESSTSSNGWTVSLDIADPVETISLSNGWTVEVVN